MSIILCLLVFSLLVVIHEFGHFLFAKLSGVNVIEFSVGMGPRLISFEKGGTRYSLKLILFGGSCQMEGEDEDEETPSEGSFNNASVWARILIVAGGPLFNFISAFIMAMIIVGCAGVDQPVLTGVIENYPAQEAGLQAGDKITKLNDKNVVVYRDITLYLALHPGEELDVKYSRGGQEYETTIQPLYSEEYGSYMMGIQVSGGREKTDVLGTIGYGAYEVKYWIDYTFTSLRLLVTRTVSVDNISGPVGVVSTMSQVVEESSQDGAFYVFLNLLQFCILLSANLGVMNLLPIPALDGGRLVFLIIEAILGHPINRKFEGWVHFIGFALLMALMVLVLFNDIRKLIP